jgi:hypothetical protein
MKISEDHRAEFVNTISHIRSATTKVIANSGKGKALSFPDAHKISEGLFLSAVTHWEEFCQSILIVDVAKTKGSLLTREVKLFRTKNASFRVAELIFRHVDHPRFFYDWSDFSRVVERANTFLAPGHRYDLPPARVTELSMFKRIRNAIAHKSDKAAESFMKLVASDPFILTTNQRKGITPGRFLCNQQWGGQVALHHALDSLEAAARALVP